MAAFHAPELVQIRLRAPTTHQPAAQVNDTFWPVWPVSAENWPLGGLLSGTHGLGSQTGRSLHSGERQVMRLVAERPPVPLAE